MLYATKHTGYFDNKIIDIQYTPRNIHNVLHFVVFRGGVELAILLPSFMVTSLARMIVPVLVKHIG